MNPEIDANDSCKIIEEFITKANGDKTVKSYSKGRILGKGGFATVYEFVCIENNLVAAGKIVSKNCLQKTRARQKLMFEIKIHRSLHHLHIVRFERFFEDCDNIYILLELCPNQTMNELLRRRKRLTELEIQCYIAQIVQALKYLHAHRVIHRDIKLGNLFLSEKLEIKLGDFGLATKLEFDDERKRTICGTPNYIAPEILEGKHGHSYEVDFWSLGVLVYTLATGKPPFETPDVKLTYKKIKMVAYTYPDQVKLSDELKDLISRLLVADPRSRIPLDEVLVHPFMQKNPVPKTLPLSTLAVPPSGSYIKQFHSCTSYEKSMHSRGSSQSKISDDLRSTTSKEEEKSAGELSNDLRCKTTRESINSLASTARRLAVVSAYSYIENNSKVWVKKWVDYSSKYGLGYILSNACVGVFFNDSSKLISEPKGSFMYIYKKGQEEVTEKYGLTRYPESIKKKVTLLEHFRKHLTVENPVEDSGSEIVYVKKWLLTEHAVIFRLSDKTVHIRFVDKSELVLSSTHKTVSYLDKNGMTELHLLKAAVSSDNKELSKRIKYTTEMINRMLAPQAMKT